MVVRKCDHRTPVLVAGVGARPRGGLGHNTVGAKGQMSARADAPTRSGRWPRIKAAHGRAGLADRQSQGWVEATTHRAGLVVTDVAGYVSSLEVLWAARHGVVASVLFRL